MELFALGLLGFGGEGGKEGKAVGGEDGSVRHLNRRNGQRDRWWFNRHGHERGGGVDRHGSLGRQLGEDIDNVAVTWPQRRRACGAWRGWHGIGTG